MTRDEARVLISGLIEWYTEDLGERLGMSMGKDAYMDALDALWHGPEGELIRRADAIGLAEEAIHDEHISARASLYMLRAELTALPSADADINQSEYIIKLCEYQKEIAEMRGMAKLLKERVAELERNKCVYPSAEAVHEWIPCSERLPKELEAVNVTWVNHNPPCYYMDIMNVPFTGVCVRYSGNWYWWDSTICDVLGEYGEECGAEPIDKYIEITAWMPLPTPYKGGDDE